MRKRVFARHAWLGPGEFAERVLVEFDSRIVSVDRLEEGEAAAGDAVRVDFLIPGLVNAHCHLEYSWLAGKLPRGGIPFGDWMQAIMGSRPQTDEDLERRRVAMVDAAESLINGGCTAVFDSTTDGSSAAALSESGLRYFLFHEVLGLSRDRAEPMWDGALSRIGLAEPKPGFDDEQAKAHAAPSRKPAATGEDRVLGHGLNPHAPYSVGAWLRDQLRDGPVDLPQAWHVAETEDEVELFRSGDGSIAGFLNRFGLALPEKRAESPFEFLRGMGQLKRCAVAFHGNWLSAEAAQWFRAPRAVVHCPGTHRWFQRSAVPLKQWIESGVNVCIGTDSLASADTLSMLDVVRMTLDDNADLTVDDVLTMACVNPWRIDLGGRSAAEKWGRMDVGSPADMVAIGGEGRSGVLPDGPMTWKELFSRGARTVAVWVAGDSLRPG